MDGVPVAVGSLWPPRDLDLSAWLCDLGGIM